MNKSMLRLKSLFIIICIFGFTGVSGQSLQPQQPSDDDGPSLMDEEQPFQQEQPQPGLDFEQQRSMPSPTPESDRTTRREYVIGGIDVKGAVGVSPGMVTSLAGLSVGQNITIPGENISSAIKKLWEQDFFSDVSISVSNITNGQVFLIIEVATRNRLSNYEISGEERRRRKRSIEDKLELEEGDLVTEYYISRIERRVNDYYLNNGYPNAKVTIESRPDSLYDGNSVFLDIHLYPGERVRISEINFYGNEELSRFRLRRTMQETKQRQRLNFFRSSKFLEDKYEADKKQIIRRYQNEGYRDAQIVADSVYYISDKLLAIDIHIDEGNRYYFGDVTWTGNTKYESSALNRVLGIQRGDVYSPDRLQMRLQGGHPEGNDVASLYMDDGHLFFNARPIEQRVTNDTVDVQIQINEGPQAVINEVTFTGNTKTNDHVILREIRTRPGKKFSRSDVIRSQRELAQLGYFDQEKMDVIPRPNPESGTVDIEYKLVERESDQVELSGGYGGNMFVFTLGLEFNNFSLRNINNREAWRPLPTGDGQRLSLRAQSTGMRFRSYNLSFTEPWFGGRKPNSFNFSIFHSLQSDGRPTDDPNRQSISITGASVGLGKRLTWPDDYFTLNNIVTYQRYNLSNYQTVFAFTDGQSNNLNFEHRLTRNSIDAPIYPRRGSRTSLSFTWTPPYSIVDNRDYDQLDAQERFRWLEYNKWRFESSWFFALTEKLVLNARADFGLLGRFDRNREISPFERFFVGGDGLSGFQLDGRELIRLRGYPDESIGPRRDGRAQGGNVFNKFTFELRYPISLNPNATIYMLTFAEAGNNWLGIENFDPFDLKRSVGGGIRVFLPMFGMLGFDVGYRFDEFPGSTPDHGRWDTHISIGERF